MIDIGLLFARLIIGLAIAAHGAQKALGWFGGHGLKGTGGFFQTLGFRPGILFAGLASGGEILGGVLTASGLFGPVGPALIVIVMIVAAGSLHIQNGFFATKNGIEIHTLYIASALALAYAGPGSLSLDAAFGLGRTFTGLHDTWAVASGVALGLITLALRRKSTPSSGLKAA